MLKTELLLLNIIMPIALPILIGAAIIDSINPCAFGVLIFLLAYLTKTTNQPIKLLIHGFVYIFAVFLTYLIAGIFLLGVLQGLGGISQLVYAALGVLIIIAGLVELKDFFWYGRGFSLALFPGTSERIKMYAGRISDSAAGAFGLGVFVAIVELPCTGAVYLAILSLISLAGVSISSIVLLFLYNIIFVLPLIVILILFYRGAEADVIEKWRRKHRGLMRGAIGLTLIGLGAWMIWFAYF